jgi:hypothetical protein
MSWAIGASQPGEWAIGASQPDVAAAATGMMTTNTGYWGSLVLLVGLLVLVI